MNPALRKLNLAMLVLVVATILAIHKL